MLKIYETQILEKTKNFVYQSFNSEGTGHDYYHIERVVENAKKITKSEDANPFLVELAAWLHDLGDYKLHNGIDRSAELISAFLQSIDVEENIINKIIKIVSEVSFSKGLQPTSIEAKIVQDADRLDAIGAVGIARCFAYGGSKGKLLFDPKQKEDSSVQHFYDKLFKLKELMHTATAREIAIKRHEFMELYLHQFYTEINYKVPF